MTDPNAPTPEAALALRAMTCPNWKVANGVLDLRGARLANLPPLSGFNVVFCLPDFRDAQTLEHLRSLVRTRCGEAAVTAAQVSDPLDEAALLLTALDGAKP